MGDLPFSIYVQIISDHEEPFQTVCIPNLPENLLMETQITMGHIQEDQQHKVIMTILCGPI